MSRIVQLLVFLLLLGPTAVQQVHVWVAPHSSVGVSFSADTRELAGTSEPLQPALLAGAPAVRPVFQADSAVLLPRIAAPLNTAAESATVDESGLPARTVPGSTLGRAPPTLLS